MSVKIGMDGLTAMSAHLEPAVTAGARSLEILPEASLAEANKSYELTKPQRKEVLADLDAVAARSRLEPPGSTTWSA